MKQKFLSVLLSLVIATGLWVYVVTVISPESEETFSGIPVILNGSTVLNERGLMITTERMPSVTLKLYGNRSDLRKLNSSNIAIIMDVSRISEAGEKELTYTVSYPPEIPSGSVQILSQFPERIGISVKQRKTTSIPVQLEYIGKVPAQYIVDKMNLELDHDTISVEGPEEVIEKIHHARVDVDLTDRTETINQSFRYTLCDENGEPVNAEQVMTSVAEIQLKLTIQMVKKIDLVLNVVAGGGATELNTNIKMEPSSIQVSGSEQLLAGLDKLELGTINLGECPEGTVKVFDLAHLLPSGVTNLTGTDKASVTLSFPGMVTKDLKITNILSQNVPEGLKAEILATDITVKVRGPELKIQLITEANVTVFVDFSKEDKGVSQLAAEVYFDEAFSDVGVMGTYYVYGMLETDGDTG